MTRELAITPWLLDAIGKGQAVLFLGAGASIGAQTSTGARPPTGIQLRDSLSDRFLGGRKKDMPLDRVADYAIGLSSLREVQAFVRDQLEPLQPATFHRLIARFRWHAIATTNYDLVVERAYDQEGSREQQLRPIVRDGDPVSDAISRPDLVPYLKLHGCLTVANDPGLPFILSSEQYARHRTNRARLFVHLTEWGREHPIVFVGHDISDPNIQQILFDLTDQAISRPLFAVVRPDLDEMDEAYWRARRFDVLQCTFEEFLGFLNSRIPLSKRTLSAALDSGRPSFWSRVRTATARPTDLLVSALENDIDHVHAGHADAAPDPYDFYRGLEVTWRVFQADLDVRRRVTDDLLVSCLEAAVDPSDVQVILLRGHAGSGKDVTLRRVAWEAATQHDQFVFWLRENGSIRFDVIREIAALTGQRMLLVIDDAVARAREVEGLIAFARRERIPITLLVGVRTNEWNVAGTELARHVKEEFELRDLSGNEIGELLKRLEAHGCLGHLASLSEEERFRELTLTSDRQLLVALHEATSGKSFEELVFDEYDKVTPSDAQLLYLDVCTLNRLGVPVRAGLISRVSDISFTDFRVRLLRPLERVVKAVNDSVSGDYAYRARHPLIAKFVFEQALPSAPERSDQIARIVRYLNVDYRWDSEAFERLIRGRTLAELFADRQLAERVYEAAEESGGDRVHILHQRAVFELRHNDGQPRRALKFIRKALEVAGDGSAALRHTEAMVLRRLAASATSPEEANRYRADARRELEEMVRTCHDDVYPFTGLGQVLLDEIRLALADASAKDRTCQRQLAGLVAEAEKIISDGLQYFPNDPHLSVVQSDLSELLRNKPQAISALESAFTAAPRDDSVAVRLARLYEAQGREEEARGVLRRCLEVNPGSKRAHLRMARMLAWEGERANSDQILHHLKRSFTEGDNQLWAQFHYGRHHYLYGDPEEADRMFRSLRKRRLGPAQRDRYRAVVRDARREPVVYSGVVDRVFDNYCFLRVTDTRSDLFVHHSQFSPREWERVVRGALVECNLGFAFNGPAGINATVVG